MKLYNSMTHKQTEFNPDSANRVQMYVCGITPYAPCHVGHALSYVVFDVIKRYLEFRGLEVYHVQNFTDIDDKIIERASDLKIDYRDLADKYIVEYKTLMDQLNVKHADKYPLATNEIPNIIIIITDLIYNDWAYMKNGSVYFRVTKDINYGKLSHRSLENMIAGARVEIEEDKEHPMDFALWKGSKPGEPYWDSPWGPGRPGWHIECTTICLKHLGETIDIHGGGIDLVFPHHENEIAQSEAHTGIVPFARFWIHNGLLKLGTGKMSKSGNNLVELADVLKRNTPDALRLFLLSSHYRSPLTYSETGLDAMERATTRLRNSLATTTVGGPEKTDFSIFEDSFHKAMESDINTPQAIGALFSLSHEINKGKERGESVIKGQKILLELGEILGLTFKEFHNTLSIESLKDIATRTKSQLISSGFGELAKSIDSIEDKDDPSKFVDALLYIRWELRILKGYKLADEIRSDLSKIGIISEDGNLKTIWKYQAP